jgi:hypothetical protein
VAIWYAIRDIQVIWHAIRIKDMPQTQSLYGLLNNIVHYPSAALPNKGCNRLSEVATHVISADTQGINQQGGYTGTGKCRQQQVNS